jgi:hypothetical protein
MILLTCYLVCNLRWHCHATMVQCFSTLAWYTCLWIHDAHAHVVWCWRCMLARPGYPPNELVIEVAIVGWGVCMASRILTTKIPSTLLVAIIWLQHIWCPRFRRDTFGYGTTVSPNIREISMSKEVSMWMHVSSPKVPKCTCFANTFSRRDIFIYLFIYFQNVVSKTMRNKLMIGSSK